MKKFIQTKLKEQKGLTLIELLAVIVILAIIAAIAIPAIGNIIQNSRVGAVKADGLNIISAGELYFTENSSETSVTMATLRNTGFLDDEGSFKAGDEVVAPTVYRVPAVTSGTVAPAKTTIIGTAVSGNIKIQFGGTSTNGSDGATKADINKIKNSERPASAPVVITAE